MGMNLDFEEGDTVEFEITGLGPSTYLAHEQTTTVTADVLQDRFLALHDDIGGLDEARIDDVDSDEDDDGKWAMLVTFDSDQDEGPHWAGVITACETVE